jgi:hypothetical protein
MRQWSAEESMTHVPCAEVGPKADKGPKAEVGPKVDLITHVPYSWLDPPVDEWRVPELFLGD